MVSTRLSQWKHDESWNDLDHFLSEIKTRTLPKLHSCWTDEYEHTHAHLWIQS